MTITLYVMILKHIELIESQSLIYILENRMLTKRAFIISLLMFVLNAKTYLVDADDSEEEASDEESIEEDTSTSSRGFTHNHE